MSSTEELIQKATEVFGPELTLALLKNRAILADVVSGDIEYIGKARGFRSGHDGKMRDAGTGKFSPMDGPVTTKLDNGMVVSHGGSVHPVLRRLASLLSN
jgi:hypothetical protein